MFEHMVGLLTEVLWRGDLQELDDGFRYDDQVCLRLLTSEDFSYFGISPSKPQKYYMGIEVKMDEGVSGFEVLDDVLLSLQLLRNALVFYESIYFWAPDRPHRVKPSLDAPNITFMHALGMDELVQSREIFTHVRKMGHMTQGSLKIACDRYGRIKTTKFTGDQLIDACVAYEALFFEGQKSGGNRGLAIAIACSMLLGESIEERKKIKEVIQTGFRLRNKIMHGSDYPTDSVVGTRYPFIDYLRQSIVKLLKQIN